MDWQYGAAPLGFQPVESVDQASHVRGAVLVCTSERARDRVHHDQAWIDSARVEEELVCDALDCLNDLCRGESVMERRQAIRQKNWRAFQRSEEHTSELQSLMRILYAVFCLKKKQRLHNTTTK